MTRSLASSAGAGCAALALLVGSPSIAQDGPPQAAAPEGFFDGIWSRDYLLGFGPVRDAWEGRGINVDLYYTVFLGWNAEGGRNPDARRYSHSLDLFVRADTERMGLWPGGMFLLQAKSNRGENINPDVGALSQVVDDADFDEYAYVDQLYYEHVFRDEKTRLRAGYLDYQTMIDRNAYANIEDVQFMNAALDNNLLVPLKIGFGAALLLNPADWLGVILGTADGENEILDLGLETAFGDDRNLMAYGEVTVKTGARGTLPGNYRWGVFYDPRSRPDYAAMETTTGGFGTWLSLDQMVYREREGDRQGLGLFYRYGYREEESYSIARFHSGGLEYLGLFPRRDADALGIGFYDLVASDEYVASVDPAFAGESGFESYYRVQVSPWFAVSPGVQYIRDPGGKSANPDAVAVILRLRTRF